MSKDGGQLSLDRPTSYKAQDGTTPEAEHCAGAALNQTKAGNGHKYGIYGLGSGLDVKLGENNVFHVSTYDKKDNADVIIYGGYDSHGPQLGLTKFTQQREDFDVYLGGLRSPGAGDWDVVQCASDGRMFHSPYYRFHVPLPSTSGASKKKLQWKKTHESELGSSRFSTKDFKLIDEDNDEVVAVYIDCKSGIIHKNLRGEIDFRCQLGDSVETAVILVLLTILERRARYLKGVARAFPVGN